MKKFIAFIMAMAVAVLLCGSPVEAANPYATNATLLKESTARMSFDCDIPGVVLCRSGNYTTAGTEYNGTTIRMVTVPKGAMILDVDVYTTGIGWDGNFTWAVGDDSDVNRYFTVWNATYPVNTRFSRNATGVTFVSGQRHVYHAEDTIDLQLEHAGTCTNTAADLIPSGKELRLDVFYKMMGVCADETNENNY